jgi:hypothetical protein
MVRAQLVAVSGWRIELRFSSAGRRTRMSDGEIFAFQERERE